MRIVQFEIPGIGRRVGFIDGELVLDLTAGHPELRYLCQAFDAARGAQRPLPEFLLSLASASSSTLEYAALLASHPGGTEPFLHAPLDHPDPHAILITGTGLTHTGSMQSRDQMHGGSANVDQAAEPVTDSAKMFEMGRRGGKPEPKSRGVAPEWFYKGDGGILRGHQGALELPAYGLDGGEEPEIVGCYIIDERGRPRRVGFALGNEWSDHATEQINYLYLAPSKLRTCAVGPSLNTMTSFEEVSLRCTIARGAQLSYDSGEIKSGEKWMTHSLANLEDHHFKYAQHRRPGDVHLHFFGTSKLSHSSRTWKFQPGDTVRIEAPDFSAALENPVVAGAAFDTQPIVVEPA